MLDVTAWINSAKLPPDLQKVLLASSDIEVISIEPVLKSLFDEALSFFVCSDSSISVGDLLEEEFYEIRRVVRKINYLNGEESTAELKFRNNAARRIYEQTQQRRKKVTKKDESINLPNIISAVSVGHNSYNLTNIWELTIYQLYDQFFRQNMKVQMDTIGLRWAAWGKDKFDFDMWYRDLLDKK